MHIHRIHRKDAKAAKKTFDGNKAHKQSLNDATRG